MKYQTIALLASSPLIVGFAPQALQNLNRHVNLDGRRGSMKRTSCTARTFLPSNFMDDRQRAAAVSPPIFASKYKTGALFAKPRASLEDDDEDDYDEDDEDEEEEEEEEEDEGEACRW